MRLGPLQVITHPMDDRYVDSTFGGSLTIADGLTLGRIGYSTMQLAGQGVWGPARDRGEAIAVLRETVERDTAHIDSSFARCAMPSAQRAPAIRSTRSMACAWRSDSSAVATGCGPARAHGLHDPSDDSLRRGIFWHRPRPSRALRKAGSL